MKKNKSIMILGILMVLLAVAGVTYAFFTATITNGDKGSSVTLELGVLRLTYSDGQTINETGIFPGHTYSKTVTVTNTGNLPANYDMVWIQLLNTFIVKSDLVMSISCSSSQSTCDGLSETPVSGSGENVPIFYGVPISVGEVHTYTITITFKETGSNQNQNQGRELSGKIGIVEALIPSINLYGYIYDDASNPMNNVLVELHSDVKSALTDATGKYEIPEVKIGQHTMYVKTSDGSSTIMTKVFNLKSGELTKSDNDDIYVSRARDNVGINLSKNNTNPIIALVPKVSGTLKGTLGDPSYEGEFYAGYNNNRYKNIYFEDEIDVPSDAVSVWDASEDKNSTVMAYMVFNYEQWGTSYYDLHIQSEYKIYAPTNSKYLFPNFSYVNHIYGIEYLDTSKVTDMYGMFSNMASINQLNLNNFDTSKVTNMSYMFNSVGAAYIYLSNFDTSNVTNMSLMFYDCNLVSIDLSNFNTSKVTNMSNMFNSDEMYINSIDLKSFDTSKVTDMSGMFGGLKSLTYLDLSSFDTSKVTDMSMMFQNCQSLQTLNLSNFITSNVVYTISMFAGCRSLTSINLSNFDTSNVINMAYMFQNCASMITIDFSTLNTSNVTDMSFMFYGCSGLTSLNLASLNTSNVTDMSFMFYGCSGLTSLDVTPLNTSNVASMSEMFGGCSGLTALNLTLLNTSSVTDMSSMFEGCSTLTSLDLSTFNTSSVTNMSLMFDNCSGLTSLDLSNFVTASVYTIYGMFENCTNLASLNLSGATFNNPEYQYIEYRWDGVITSISHNLFDGITSGITIYVKDNSAQTFINARLNDVSKTGTVTIG